VTAPRLLISPGDLAARLTDPNLLLLDCRHDLMNPQHGPHAYASGHIPGAVRIDLDQDLAAPKTGSNGRHPLPAPDVAAVRFAAKGVRRDRAIVLYDDAGHNYSVRAWWMLRWLGHPDVALLDGGYPAWVAAGGAVDREPAVPVTGAFSPAPRLGATVDVHYMQAFHALPSVCVIDARAPERFRGEHEPIDPVAGHIPGAQNRWFKQNLNPDGTFKSPTVLAEEFSRLLAGRSPREVVHQCGSGVTACHNLFAMELAGLCGSRLYPGSWSEWIADPSRPVASGG
jgi:thiosulfate/3-mercaptopyruvate sulfurtransferase